MLLKEILKDLNRWQDKQYSWIRKIIWLKCQLSPTLIYTLNTNRIKIPTGHFFIGGMGRWGVAAEWQANIETQRT